MIVLDDSIIKKFERLKAKLNDELSIYELIMYLLEDALKNPDANARGRNRSSESINAKSRYIPVSEKRKVFTGKCANCGVRYNLEYDHIIPFSQGGTATEENIRLLCRTHNQLKAIEKVGYLKMNKFINKKPK